MRVGNLSVGITLAIALTADLAWGQSEAWRPMRQPASIQRTAFEYDYMRGTPSTTGTRPEVAATSTPLPTAPSPSDVVVRPPQVLADSVENGEGYPAWDEVCGAPCGPWQGWLASDPWKLPQPCLLQKLGIQTGGWVQGGITLNGEDPKDRQNGPICTNDRAGEFQMNQLWLYFERPVNTGGCGWDVGGRFDLFYGTDWRIAELFGNGLEDEINGQDQFYGLAIPQFYLEGAINDLSVKVGRMAGILGYEMVPPIGNFFYSHSYMLCYGEPILITGAMGKYKLSDRWSVLGGFHRGFNQFEDNNDNLNFQGGLMYDNPDSGVALGYALDAGRNDAAALQDQYVHSLVFKYQVNPKLLYVFQNDYGFTNGVGGDQDAQWYGINQYLLYQLNAKWSAGMRAEWFRDEDGTRVGGLGNFSRGWMGPGGYAGNFTELTMGLNWRPKANILFRPEVRWDWYDGPASTAGGGAYPLPFDDGRSSHQFTLATDVIVTF